MKKTKKLTASALLCVLAVILGYVEASLLPQMPYGIKIGIGNTAVLAALYILGTGAAAAVAFSKAVLCAALYAGFAPMLYSLSGAALSVAVQAAAKKTGIFGIVGVSSLGAMFHNIGQILCAYVFMGRGVLYYLPVLMLCGAMGGIPTGLAAQIIIKKGGRNLGKSEISSSVAANTKGNS